MFLIAGSLDESHSPMAQSIAISSSVRSSDFPMPPVPLLEASAQWLLRAIGPATADLGGTRENKTWVCGLEPWEVGRIGYPPRQAL